MIIEQEKLKRIIEAAILATGQPINLDQLLKLFIEEEKPSRENIRAVITLLQEDYTDRGMELIEVSSGYRIQAKQNYSQWVSRLWEEKPARYSRALLETLVLIAYKQPITRGEIENVRGVGVSSNIMKTLQEREWVRVVGHRDVPGKPAIYATTRKFLDYFNLKSLDQLPTLSEIRDLDKISAELEAQEDNVGAPEVEHLVVEADIGETNSDHELEDVSAAGDNTENSGDEDLAQAFDQQKIAEELKDLSATIQNVDHDAETYIEASEHSIEEIETDLSHINVENLTTIDAIKADPMEDDNLIVEIIHNTVISEESLHSNSAEEQDSKNSASMSFIES